MICTVIDDPSNNTTTEQLIKENIDNRESKGRTINQSVFQDLDGRCSDEKK